MIYKVPRFKCCDAGCRCHDKTSPSPPSISRSASQDLDISRRWLQHVPWFTELRSPQLWAIPSNLLPVPSNLRSWGGVVETGAKSQVGCFILESFSVSASQFCAWQGWSLSTNKAFWILASVLREMKHFANERPNLGSTRAVLVALPRPLWSISSDTPVDGRFDQCAPPTPVWTAFRVNCVHLHL